LFDSLIAWLMRPLVRRIRRWSFVATVPTGILIANVYGIHEGVVVVAARLALWGFVAVAAWRLGGERGDALRDLLMHPRGRAFARAEFDILTALPRLVLARLARMHRPGLTYERGTFGLALALAFTPAVLTEALALHLLLGGGWIGWTVDAIHAYMLVWLWGFALGPRAFPHRVGMRTAVLRAGPMYRVCIPRRTITAATARPERVPGERGLVERDDVVLLPVRGRIDVWLDLAEPVHVQRPLHEPLETRRLAVASDDPKRLIEQLLAPLPEARTTGDRHAIDAGVRLLATLDIASLTREAVQPS